MAERLVHSFVRLTLRHRWFSLAWLAALTVFFAYQALAVQMYSQFSDLLPQAHPYIKAYNHFRQIFGSANVMTLELQVKHGDIFTAKTLNKIRYIHQQVDLIDGVDHYLVTSITGTSTSRKVIATSGGLIISKPLLPDDIPTSSAALARLRVRCAAQTRLWSPVSPDGKSAAGHGRLQRRASSNYGEMHRRMANIKRAVEDDNTVLYAAGEPVLKAWCWYYKGELAEIFGVTGLFIFCRWCSISAAPMACCCRSSAPRRRSSGASAFSACSATTSTSWCWSSRCW